MAARDEGLMADVVEIGKIPFLPALLELVCGATGMGFAAVARVTPERWVAGAVRDTIRFGLSAGDDAPIKATICHEIRQHRTPVVVGSVSHDVAYCNHPALVKFGLESYISFPIIRRNGEFFGTLCAIDPAAAPLNTQPMYGLFQTLAGLIAQYLDGVRTLAAADRDRLEAYLEAQCSGANVTLRSGALRDREQKMELLSQKIYQLIMAVDPHSIFVRSAAL